MVPGARALIKDCYIAPVLRLFHFYSVNPVPKSSIFFISATCSTLCQIQVENFEEGAHLHPPRSAAEVLKKWGCSDDDIKKMFIRQPSLRNAKLDNLQTKLTLLSGLGVSATDLVKMINCRPKILRSRIDLGFDERLEYFKTLFESKETLLKAVVRNPSFLTYNLHEKIKPVVELYRDFGISRQELSYMLMSRPTLIPRSSFCEEKVDYIRRSGVTVGSKMYKYVVGLIGVSRIETIRAKMGNLEKFGFSDDEVLGLFGRSPLLLSLSTDKVQRNMTFVLASMKLPARTVLDYPFLLYSNLEAVLKPRIALAEKIEEMGLNPQIRGPLLMRALRMTEKRFLKFFVMCHAEETAGELLQYYEHAKCVKRLAAEASKKHFQNGFPF